MDIIIEQEIRDEAPWFKVVVVEADVLNHDTSDDLWQELLTEGNRIRKLYEMSDINKRSGIAATRRVYKALGKEPNRYRPSSEALCRRLVKGMELYRTLTLIDLINLLSIRSGYSIGGFDADKINGEILKLGVGREGEKFNAIGRGELNIASLPIYRDSTGGIGTPTSDEERTKLSESTTRLLMCINIYEEELPVQETITYATDLLMRYASASNIKVKIVTA